MKKIQASELKAIIKDNRAFLRSVSCKYATYVVHYDLIAYQFCIPLDDIGTGVLHDIEKAITLMRWIRKAIEDGSFVPWKEPAEFLIA